MRPASFRTAERLRRVADAVEKAAQSDAALRAVWKRPEARVIGPVAVRDAAEALRALDALRNALDGR